MASKLQNKTYSEKNTSCKLNTRVKNKKLGSVTTDPTTEGATVEISGDEPNLSMNYSF